MINAGYSIRTDSGSQLIFGKPLGVPAEWGYVISYSLTETPPTVRIVAEPRAVQYFSMPNETDYTKFSSYGERARWSSPINVHGDKHSEHPHYKSGTKYGVGVEFRGASNEPCKNKRNRPSNGYAYFKSDERIAIRTKVPLGQETCDPQNDRSSNV